MDKALHKDLKTLAVFIEIYCRDHHASAENPPEHVALHTHNVEEIVGDAVRLCPECTKLLAHAWVKRSRCPMNPKPACKHCPNHCYAPDYRRRIQEVMRYSGKRMVLSGRVDYLLKLLF